MTSGLRVAALVVSCLAGAVPVRAELLVHYTFDNDDIIGTSIIDSAGNDQTASRIVETGGLGVETGISGVLGEAVRIPNDDGLSYIRLRGSNNPAPSGNDPRTIAFFFSQEAIGVDNTLFGYGTSAPGTSFDVSLEGGGIRLRYAGGNVTWGSGFDFTGADAGFHHLAIRVPDNALDYLDVEVLLDGNPLTGVPTAGNPGSAPINTGGGAQSELNIGRSPVFSPAGDYIGLIDDFRIYDTALSDQEIRALLPDFRELLLEVDPNTGAAAIRNPGNETITLDYYEVRSSTDAITPGLWSSLAQQNRMGFPSGSGAGDGWEVVGSATSSFLGEARLQGVSSLEPGEWIDLGTIYDPAKPQAVEFVFHDGTRFRTGDVEFTTAGPTADFDRNGVVDAADLMRWQAVYGVAGSADASADGDSAGEDFLAWQRQLDAAPAGSTVQAVPEPSALGMLAVGAAAVVTALSRSLRR